MSNEHSQPPRSGRNFRRNRGRSSGKRVRSAEKAKLLARPLPEHRLTAEIDDSTFIIFDIETTGGNPERNGITEICAFKYVQGKEVGKFYSLVNPKIPIPPIVRKMTGISNKTVQDAPFIEEVMPKFVEFAGHGILVSHNTIGDLKFLRHFSKETTGAEMPNFFLCTHLLCDKLCGNIKDKTLNGLGKHFNIESENLHRADADAALTVGVFFALVQKLKEQKIDVVEDAIRYQGDYESSLRLGWGVDSSSLVTLPDRPGVFVLKDRRGKETFFASAFNLKREIRKLENLSLVPKGIMRQVIQSVEVATESANSQLEALFLESEYLSRGKKQAVDPFLWHQRMMTMVNFVREPNGQTRITVGPVTEGAFAVFGPVRDRRIVQNMLDSIAAAIGVESGKKGLLLDAFHVTPVVAFFKGDLHSKGLPNLNTLTSLATKLIGIITGRQTSTERVAEKLRQCRLEARMTAIHEMRGAAILKSEKKVIGFDLQFGVINGSPRVIAEEHASADWKAIVQQEKTTTPPKSNPSTRTIRPLTEKDAHRLNALIWWIYSGSNRNEGEFISF